MDDLITTAQAADILGRSHRTIHRAVASGDLVPALTSPGGRFGAFLFRREDVERLASERVAS